MALFWISVFTAYQGTRLKLTKSPCGADEIAHNTQ